MSYPSPSPYHSYPSFGSQNNNNQQLDRNTNAPKDPFDYEADLPPKSSSNTYQMTENQTMKWTLPPGWKVAYRETDGRMYYFELVTGKTSWNHPLSPLSPTHTNTPRQESVAMASKRPDSHQCCAVFSCIAFPPLGIFALVHSILTYRAWSKGKYGDAFDHSRQAYSFAWWAIAIFLAFVAYRVFIDGPGWEIFNIFNW